MNITHEYYKITTLGQGKDLASNLAKIKDNDLTVVVYNFVDMLSHSRTEMDMIKELGSDDKAYRSLTLSWFRNSPSTGDHSECSENGTQSDHHH